MEPLSEDVVYDGSDPQIQQEDDLGLISMPSAENVDLGRAVFIPDESDGYVRGRVVDILSDSLVVKCNPPKDCTVSVPYSQVLPCDEESGKDVDDNCALMYLNEGTLLENCKTRYSRKQIYTYVANILISINPYECLPDLYSTNAIAAYRGKSLGTLPPHVFAIADKAYRDMKRHKESQSIIVSGESGAGKTETQKSILKYLCENWCSEGSRSLEEHVLETNPILEAFGNAKTLRNNNSSRFGKFIEIHFQENGTVAGGHVSHYLLEKSRVCIQQSGERNYHIFYQMFAGTDDKFKESLGLSNPESFEFLRHGCTKFFTDMANPHSENNDNVILDEVVNDSTDFQRLVKSLKNIGFGEKALEDLFKLLAGILHLGNVKFEDSDDVRGGCKITSDSDSSVEWSAKLLGIGRNELVAGLTSRIMQPTRGGVKGTVIQVRLKQKEAEATRDTLAKTIYGKLFDEVVAKINACFPFESSKHYIGVLDIAGFEFFKTNSFEQFCINYCNEKLQEFFNDRILKQEQELYKAESLDVPQIEYNDNQDCIQLFEKKGGLLDLLDEEARLPKPSFQHFTTAVHQSHAGHFRLSTNRSSKVKEYRSMREDECFIIRHFAGSVCYQTSQFLEKNNNTLHASLEGMVSCSNNVILIKLFDAVEFHQPRNKLISSSASALFRQQLGKLLEKLRQTGTHFVRCIKPNGEMMPGKFEGSQILGQLRYSGMESVLRLMQKGFPSRTMFSELYDMYSSLLPEKLARLDHRLFCKCLFHVLGLNESDFKFGMTKVFFKPGKFAEFDQLLRHDPQAMQEMIGKVQSWLFRLRWRKVQYGVLSCVKLQKKIIYRAENALLIQRCVRGFLIRRKVCPRMRLGSTLVNNMKDLDDMINTLIAEDHSNADLIQEATDHKTSVKNGLKALMENVQVFVNDGDRSLVAGMDKRTSDLITGIKTKLIEKEEARKEMIELEEKRNKILEKARLEEEREQKRIQALKRIQQQLKAEALLRKEREEQEKFEQLKREEKERQDQLDSELAKRLAQEKSVQLNEDPRPSTSSRHEDPNDLTQWTYATLRDTINTTTDIELISACRNEFHRRLRVYQNWKKANARRNP
ncbi:unnamed protein product [Bursaphelenchus xylophilus]|uniref:(pine wood nematode) hypothetical protein n=1 Tax=Bursaphelenchus xylophilus TaxID=6326 RepID=A0A1I7SAC6_BURXY|nr:unnamed protein product [Bursaphelenchus xylophilus]CAG9084068.1 unnamed protein product [Bursaphelenchus xylophilus]